MKILKGIAIGLGVLIIGAFSPLVAATSEPQMPQMEMVAHDFAVTSSEAKTLTRETVIDSLHGNVQFINQMAMINLTALIEADEQELEVINKGELGTYPLTLSVDFNGNHYTQTIQVTVIDDGGLSLLWIPIVIYIVTALIIGVVYLIGKKKQ